MKRWVYEALAAVVALFFAVSARLCTPAPLDPLPLPAISSDTLTLLTQRFRPTTRGTSPRSAAKGNKSMNANGRPIPTVPRMRLTADCSATCVEVHAGDLADLLWINFGLFGQLFSHLFVGEKAEVEAYISLDRLRRSCDPSVPSMLPFASQIWRIAPLLEALADAGDHEPERSAYVLAQFRELVQQFRAEQLGLQDLDKEASSSAKEDAVTLNFRADFSGEPPLILQLGGSRVRFGRALRDLMADCEGALQRITSLVYAAADRFGPHLAKLSRPPSSEDTMHVGSHPSRARALGREDRDRGMGRRSTEEIFAAVGFDPNHAPQELIERAAFELRAAYDAAYNLPKA